MTGRTYRVRFAPRAERDLLSVPSTVLPRLTRKIDALASNPRPAGCQKLAGDEDIYRVRVGDYRILYQIQGRVLLVLVLAVGHRREVYRRRS